MDRIVAFSGATNFRDLGGYETTTGAVVLSGRVLRSDSLHTLAAADLMCFDGLDIRVIYDLRGLGERNDQELPAVFHCFGGKDRTGFAAAVLLSALGVERDVVLDDNELTDQLRGAARIPEVVRAFVQRGSANPQRWRCCRQPVGDGGNAHADRYGLRRRGQLPPRAVRPISRDARTAPWRSARLRHTERRTPDTTGLATHGGSFRHDAPGALRRDSQER